MTTVTDFYQIKRANYTVSEVVGDPLIIESETDLNGVHKSLNYSVSLISGDGFYAFITNDEAELTSIDTARCFKMSGSTSFANVGRARYLALFVDADPCEVNILGEG